MRTLKYILLSALLVGCGASVVEFPSSEQSVDAGNNQDTAPPPFNDSGSPDVLASNDSAPPSNDSALSNDSAPSTDSAPSNDSGPASDGYTATDSGEPTDGSHDSGNACIDKCQCEYDTCTHERHMKRCGNDCEEQLRICEEHCGQEHCDQEHSS